MKITPCFFVGLAIGYLGAKALANANGPIFTPYNGNGTGTPLPTGGAEANNQMAQGIGAYYTDYAQHPAYPWSRNGRCVIPPVTRLNMTA